MLSNVPKGQKALCVLWRKTHVLHKLHYSMSYGAVGREFSINVAAMYSKLGVFEQRHT